ncbi:SDR family oxidoreductase [Streptomyces sp. JJ38]|uniref:SDR family oxidoreductase n=1 Tax=Streptomyces sp. JJ38 TaxID=2738128 RepID=UPI001C57196E|nr:SDR family oxidoreductase [Streptomyces sp. JJ38]MBW1599253.1 SDR family oxidoreductase [Streptomyces sp. JJ38]
MHVSHTGKGTVVVTGTSSGIGRSCALRLAADGYHVFAGVRKESDGRELRAAARGSLEPLILDVTDEANIKEAGRRVREATGDRGLAALVNNAGVGITSPAEVVPMDRLRKSFEINFFGQLAVIQEFLPQLRRGTGRLINIGSIGNRVVMPFASPLNASKWAFAAVNHALRVELLPWGIHVVLVEPASIKTAAVDKLEQEGLSNIDEFGAYERNLYGKAYRSMLKNATMHIRRLGTSPEAVGKVVVRALNAETPKARYLVGKSARPLAGIVKYAPDRVYDKIRMKVFQLPDEFGARAGEPVD